MLFPIHENGINGRLCSVVLASILQIPEVHSDICYVAEVKTQPFKVP